ncbi:hypothetical protein LOD99_14915 [Oopsacas minuta]|uniref:N-end rule aminoacyl transferase C-terminal domain-containing protein n=1 Tax=Oopsacas minuta TaxID=111878 RepID=A0AAV7KCL5_9METZ|nr:hypothetical protein LOD99_14915 [Oopsacas minuta]
MDDSIVDKLTILNRTLSNFVIILSNQITEYERFYKTVELILKQTELLRHDPAFLKLVCVTKEESQTPATEITPKNFIIFNLEIFKKLLDNSLPSNEDNLKNVVHLLMFIFSLGPPLPPIDRYFDSGAKATLSNYDNLIKNVNNPVQLFQTDEFLNQLCTYVTVIYEKAGNPIGADECMDLVIQTCKLCRGYDPFMHSFDTPVANLFKIPITYISNIPIDNSSNLELVLRLIAACPSLFIDLDEIPQPKLTKLINILNISHINIHICLAVMSCVYRLFTVSELTLDACLDDDMISPLMIEFSFLIRRHIEGGEMEDKLLRMIFMVLKLMTSCEESKIILSGQQIIVLECVNVVKECRNQSVFALGILNSISRYLSRENLALILRAISDCLKHVNMQNEFRNYFNSVILQLILIHGIYEDLDNGLSPKEFVDISSCAIQELNDKSALNLGLKTFGILFEFPKFCELISDDFIGALIKLFLESVRRESEDLIGHISHLFCDLVLQDCSKGVVRILEVSKFVPQLVKLILSEERPEYLIHSIRILKSVNKNARGSMKCEQIQYINLFDKLSRLTLTFKQEESGTAHLFDIQSNSIYILWSLSCDSSYFTDKFLPPTIITNVIQYFRNEINNIENALMDSYGYRASVHILCNIAVTDRVKMDIAATGIHTELLMVLLQLLEIEEVPWMLIDITLRLIDTITADEVYKAELIEFGLIEPLVHILLFQPSNELLFRVLGMLNSCTGISEDYRRTMCTDQLLGIIIELLKSTKDGGAFCVCCCLLASMAESQTEARLISSYDVMTHLLTATEDKELVSSCSQVERWSLNLVDKVFLNCINTPTDMTSLFLGHRTELNLLREEHFVVDRMMGLVRQGCTDCETRGCDSCTQSESLSPEEVCVYSESLSLSQYQQLINRGWYRRGGDRMYRWGKKLKLECVNWETRIRVKEFKLNQKKTFSRVLKKIPKNLTVTTVPSRFTEEGYNLYNEYQLVKHSRSRVSKQGYIDHVVNTCVPIVCIDGIDYGTFHQEYRVAGELIAIGVIDIILEGIVSIYFYYKTTKEVLKLSLGRYSSLREIQFVQELNLVNNNIQYYYLQGWSKYNNKLSYKGDYKPVEFLGRCVSSMWTEDPIESKDSNFNSLEIDRSEWLTHSIPVSVNSIQVYINGLLITFQQLKLVANLTPQQRDYIGTSLEQLCYAIGPELTQKLIIYFHT